MLLGDLNINLLNINLHSQTKEYLEILISRGFLPVITLPTRIFDKSATLIDHIYSNKINSVLCCDVITLDLSDHLATSVKISLDISFDNTQRPRNRKNDSANCDFRMFNEANDESFKHLIANETWDFPIDVDAETKYKLFMDTYMRHYNTAYPLNKNRKRRKSISLPKKNCVQ